MRRTATVGIVGGLLIIVAGGPAMAQIQQYTVQDLGTLAVITASLMVSTPSGRSWETRKLVFLPLRLMLSCGTTLRA